MAKQNPYFQYLEISSPKGKTTTILNITGPGALYYFVENEEDALPQKSNFKMTIDGQVAFNLTHPGNDGSGGGLAKCFFLINPDYRMSDSTKTISEFYSVYNSLLSFSDNSWVNENPRAYKLITKSDFPITETTSADGSFKYASFMPIEFENNLKVEFTNNGDYAVLHRFIYALYE